MLFNRINDQLLNENKQFQDNIELKIYICDSYACVSLIPFIYILNVMKRLRTFINACMN